MDLKQRLSIPFKALKTRLFSSYSNFIDCQFQMTYLYIIIIIVEYFQHLNLIQFSITYSTTIDQMYTSYPFIASTLIKVKNIFLLYQIGNYKVTRIIIFVLLCLFLLQIILVLTCKRIDITKPKPLFQSVLYSTIFFLQILYIHVLTIPILITLFSIYQCNADGFMLNFPTISCNDSEYIMIVSLSSIALFAFGIISLLNTFLFTDINPLSKCPFSSANVSNRFLSFLLEITLCIFYILSPMKTSIKAYIVFCLCIVKFIMRFYNMHFYNRKIGWMFMTFDSGELFLSITSILNNYELYVVTLHNTILEIVISTLSGICINVIVWNIRKRILLSSLSSIKTNYQIMTKAMMLIDYASDFYIDDYKRNMFMGLLHYHRFNCLNAHCKCEAYAKVLNKYQKGTLFKSINMYENINGSSNNDKEAVIDGNVEIKEYNEVKATEEDLIISENTDTIIGTDSTLGNSLTLIVDEIKDNETFHKKSESMINTATCDRELSEADCIYGFIKMNIDQLLIKKPNNIKLQMVLAYIMKNNLLNYFKGLFEMMKLMKKKQSCSNEFCINSFKSRIEKTIYDEYRNNINQNLSIETVLEYNEISNKIIDDMKEISLEMVHFWGIINFSLCTPLALTPEQMRTSKKNLQSEGGTDIYTCAISASKNIEKLKGIFEKMLMNKLFINKKVLYIYIMFLLKVIANYKEAELVKDRLSSYEKEYNSIFEQLSHQNDELYRLFRTMDRVGIVIISGDILSIGKIFSVNHQFCTIFGYPKDEISRDTVNKIVPSFISQYHDEFMYRFLETSKKHILNKLRIVFGLSREGLLIPIYLYVKAIPDLSQSVRFIGIIKELNKEHSFLDPRIEYLGRFHEIIYDKPCFMLVNQKGVIFGVNKIGLKKLGIPLNVLHITNDKEDFAISVQTIFPSTNFEDETTKAKMASDEGLIMKLDSRNIKHLFNDYKESLGDSLSPIMKIMKKMDDEEVFKEHTVYCHSFQLCFNEGQVPVQILKIILIQQIEDYLLEDEDYLNTSLDKRRLKVARKPTLLKFSTADYLNTSESQDKAKYLNNNEIAINNRKLYLIQMKNKLTSYSIPYSIKLFSAMIALFLIVFFLLSLSEYFVVIYYSKRMITFFDNYIFCSIRNYYFSIVMLTFRYLTLIDNSILPLPFNVPRNQLVNLLRHDLNITISLNHQIISYLTFLTNEYPTKVDFNQVIISMLLNTDFSNFEHKEEQALFILDYILVRISDLVTDALIEIPHVEDLFYYNSHIAHFPPPGNTVKTIFYINENGLRVSRLEMEKMVFLFNELNHQYQLCININSMIYICIPPFGVVFIGVVLFYVILKKVADYKMTILRIFYLIDGNYGVNAMKECRLFIAKLEKSMMYSEKLNHFAFENDKKKGRKSVITLNEMMDSQVYSQSQAQAQAQAIQAQSARSRNNKISILNELSPMVSGTNGTNNNNNNNTTDKLYDGVQSENASNKPLNNSMTTNEQKYIERSIAFWRFNRVDDDMANAIKEKKEYMVRQLNKSKTKFWSHLCMIYFSLILLFAIILIYTSTAIGLNFQFKTQGMNQATSIYNILSRGWSFINLLLFSWDIIIANSNTPSMPNLNCTNYTMLSKNPNLTSFDLYSLYLNQSDSIENYILFLSTKDLKNTEKDILAAFSQKEIDLNSDMYCQLLKEFDIQFWNEYQSETCEAFYLQNKGLKDHIKIVYFQLKNNYPSYDEGDVNSMIEALKMHESFIYDVLIFPTRAILLEMYTLEKSIMQFGNNHYTNCLIRLIVITSMIVIEAVIWVFTILNLITILNKDKAILILLPFESLIINDKLVEIFKAIGRN